MKMSGLLSIFLLTALFEVGCASKIEAPSDSTGAANDSTKENSQPPPMEWTTLDYGRLGIARLTNAPYPDDSRRNGLRYSDQYFPYETHYDDNRVATLIPPSFKPGREINFVVLFHGHWCDALRFMKDYGIGKTFSQSGCNAILVVPQGPNNAADSGGGKMEKPGGFERMMNELVETMKKDGAIPPDSSIGHIIVGGFSGGYRPLAFILHRGGMKDKITEAWMFDAAYDFWDYLAEPFATPKSAMVLRSIFTDHLATENIQVMSHISKSGNRFAVVEDDDLTTPGTSQKAFDQKKYHTEGLKLGEDELRLLLRRERILFIHTHLPHDAVLMSRRFMVDFLQESPSFKTP